MPAAAIAANAIYAATCAKRFAAGTNASEITESGKRLARIGVIECSKQSKTGGDYDANKTALYAVCPRRV